MPDAMNPFAEAGYRPARTLDALNAQVAHDLERLNYPANNWVIEQAGPDGKPVLDVLVVGAGMCGQAAAFALMQQGIRNIRVIDAAPRGTEGPWGTYARMNILRSPKTLTGPDLGVPSLTYRAWHEARYGLGHWSKLHKINRLDWLAYLLWVRERTGVVVENQTSLVSLGAGEQWLQAELQRKVDTPGFGVAVEKLLTRKVVLATGRDGSGGLRWPRFDSFDARSRAQHGRVFHSADPIDFERWRNARVAVLGAGASAMDNAAEALEHGARKVDVFVRRPILPQVNKSKWASFAGFMQGYHQLSDEQRWRIYTYIFDEQVPPPWESVQRCDSHASFEMLLGVAWRDLICETDRVVIVTDRGRLDYDAVILATGFMVDLFERPELAAVQHHIQRWADRIGEDQAAEFPEAARFPYLGEGFELLSRTPEAPDTLSQIHLFNYGCTMSHGALAGDIPGVAAGAQRLAQAISRDLYLENAEDHFERLLAHEESELEPTRFFVPIEERGR